MKDKLVTISFIFSIIAILISIFTFLNTGGINDIKKQLYITKQDIEDIKKKTEIRMQNRSLLFDALNELAQSVDSLKFGNIIESKNLINNAIEKIKSVENQIPKEKRNHLESIREEICNIYTRWGKNKTKSIKELEYQIIMLRIFEENI
ncbi:MAG: hypothetical protein B5M53_05220 [Candidatus Cloacimonas sp. 4484_209]|nr:MAG: hypothetical protein B5M53_05220 [Candidatus Cloacimonas sp. 4484_209]